MPISSFTTFTKTSGLNYIVLKRKLRYQRNFSDWKSLKMTTKANKMSRGSGDRTAAAIRFFLLYALTLMLTQATAFHSSRINSCQRSFDTQIQYRGVHHTKNSHALTTAQSRNINKHPVHVLQNYFRPQDNLFSGIAEIGMGFSLGVLYSEYFIIMTGCGPLNFSDTLERICYQGVIVYAGLALFNRIVTRSGLDDTVNEMFGPLQESTLWQVQLAEYLSAAAVVGAIVALQVQTTKGVSMDGLSGIDVSMCRAIRGY